MKKRRDPGTAVALFPGLATALGGFAVPDAFGIPTAGFGPGTPLAQDSPGAGGGRALSYATSGGPSFLTIAGDVMANLFGTNSLGAFVGSSNGVGVGGIDWGGVIGGLGSDLIGLFGQKQQTKQLNKLLKLQRNMALAGAGAFAPGPAAGGAGAVVGAGGGGLGALGALGGLLGGALGLGPDMLPGGLEESGTGIFGPDLFAPTASSARQRMIHAEHPSSGEMVYWRPVGRPVLFSGDLRLLKMTRKTIGRYCAPAGIQRARRGRRRR